MAMGEKPERDDEWLKEGDKVGGSAEANFTCYGI